MPRITRRQLPWVLAYGASAATRRSSVLLILTDDHGAHLGALGTKGLRTPNIDALAREGTLFINAFSATASCAPSRCALLTGAPPHVNGVWRNVFMGMIPVPPTVKDPVGVHADIPTLVEIFRKEGYYTGITAKYHLSPAEKFDFDEKIPVPKQSPQSYREAVEKFLEAAGNRPFFLMANTSFPHRPFRSRFFSHETPPVKPEDIDLPDNLPNLPEVRRDWADYLTSIQCADAITGAILAALRASGREDETLVVFAGDQGPAFVRGKATMYDLGIRVPLILRGPGVKAQHRSRKLVSLIDFAPTALDYAGIRAPGTMQGNSLRPLLEGRDTTAWREIVFAEHNAHGTNEIYPCRSACDGRMHYIRNLAPERAYKFIADAYDASPKWDNPSHVATLAASVQFPIQYELLQATVRRPPEELYDLASDRFEMRNLAGDPRYSAHLSSLRAALDAWMRDTDDPGDPTKISRRSR
jgi:N-sulfoglucosamine sulfohydrolase